MKVTYKGLMRLKQYEIYHRRWLDEEELMYVIDGKEVHLPALLNAIPHDVLLEAVAKVEAANKKAAEEMCEEAKA